MADSKPWYARGVRFKCEGLECGDCCSGRWGTGFVWVNHQEMAGLADLLGMSLPDFMLHYVRKVDGRFSLTEQPNNDCIFYREGKGCSVYEARPVQCRTYPFWPGIVASRERWDEEASRCPGINCGKRCDHFARADIEEQVVDTLRARRQPQG